MSPNPVRYAAAVTLTLPAAVQAARVVVVDVLGREVETLHAGSLPRGTTRSAFDAGALPAGVYVIRVEVPAEPVRHLLTRRLTVLR